MHLPPNTPEITQYICNICGARNSQVTSGFHRELALCRNCGANARFRGIIAVLGRCLGMPGAPLNAWPRRPGLRGLGMSDWPGYARLLEERFDYRNTFYDRSPRLDIQAPEAAWLGQMDFLISSDVLEHVCQPLQAAFDNLWRLLRPGGHLVFSVPYTREAKTVEHFPDLAEFEILQFKGKPILVNRLADGNYTVYDDLIFHGGEGATLEMRLFSEADVIGHLRQAGFADIQVHSVPDLSIGYYWPPLPGQTPDAPRLYAYPISARRPE